MGISSKLLLLAATTTAELVGDLHLGRPDARPPFEERVEQTSTVIEDAVIDALDKCANGGFRAQPEDVGALDSGAVEVIFSVKSRIAREIDIDIENRLADLRANAALGIESDVTRRYGVVDGGDTLLWRDDIACVYRELVNRCELETLRVANANDGNLAVSCEPIDLRVLKSPQAEGLPPLRTADLESDQSSN